jgi:endonuclease YncB( thermonuclease family)
LTGTSYAHVACRLLGWRVTCGTHSLRGFVVRVLDGDTIEVLHNQHAERIRLSGIDCPE